MERWQQLLRDGDPVSREPSLNGEDVDRVRRSMLNTDAAPPRVAWLPRLAIVGAAAAVLVAAVWVQRGGHRPGPVTEPYTDGGLGRPGGAERTSDGYAPAERRQVQFATPGGTRVIWVFDSTFDMGEPCDVFDLLVLLCWSAPHRVIGSGRRRRVEPGWAARADDGRPQNEPSRACVASAWSWRRVT